MGQNVRNLLITGLALSLGITINKIIQRAQHRKLVKQLKKLAESFKKKNAHDPNNSPVMLPLANPQLILGDNSAPPSSPIPETR